MKEYKVVIRPDYYDEDILIHTEEEVKFDYNNDIIMIGNTVMEVPNLVKVYRAKKIYVEAEVVK